MRRVATTPTRPCLEFLTLKIKAHIINRRAYSKHLGILIVRITELKFKDPKSSEEEIAADVEKLKQEITNGFEEMRQD